MKPILILFTIAALAQYLAIERISSIQQDHIRITLFILTIIATLLTFLHIAIRLLTTRRREPRTWRDREHIHPTRKPTEN